MSITQRLFSGTLQLTLSNALARMLSIATMPILTTLLAPRAYGAASLIGTGISLVSVFALAGIDMSYARAYFSAQPPNGESVEHFSWRLAISTALPAAVIAGLVWWFVSQQWSELDRSLAFPLAAGVLLTVLNVMSSTRARLAGRYRALAWTILATGLIGSIAGVAVAAAWRRDAVALIVPMLLAQLLPLLMLGMPSIFVLAKPSVLNKGEGTALLKIGLAGVVTAPMYWLLSSSDRWFLQFFRGAEEVGIYSIGYNFAYLGVMVNTAVMTVWLPEAARAYEEDQTAARKVLGRLMSRLVAGLALVWLAIAASGGDMVRWLANERFHSAAQVVPFIAGGVFFYGVSQLAMYGLLLVKQLKWAALWWFAAGLVCVASNWMLVPRQGGMGAAITQTLSFAFVSFAILTTSQAKYPLQLAWARVAAVLVIVIGAAVFMVPPWHAIPPLSILIKLPMGIAVSALVAWVIAPDWWSRGIGLLGRKRAESGRISREE